MCRPVVSVWQVVAVLILQAMAKTDIERLQVRHIPFRRLKHTHHHFHSCSANLPPLNPPSLPLSGDLRGGGLAVVPVPAARE